PRMVEKSRPLSLATTPASSPLSPSTLAGPEPRGDLDMAPTRSAAAAEGAERDDRADHEAGDGGALDELLAVLADLRPPVGQLVDLRAQRDDRLGELGLLEVDVAADLRGAA